MIDKYLIVLFIKSILPNFYPEQILSAVRLTICDKPFALVKMLVVGQKSCLNKQLSR